MNLGGGGRLLVLVMLLLVAGCEVTAEVTVDLEETGAGSVEVGVGFDDDAVEKAGEPATLLRTEDLADAGWEVGVPVLEDDGLIWVRASKAFGTPEEGAEVLAEVTGSEGALRDVAVAVDDGFARTTYRVDATIDLVSGLEQFSDAELTEALDGEPLGESVEAIEERFDVDVEEVFELRFRAGLPGELDDSAAPAVEDGYGVWTASLADGDPTVVRATSEVSDATPLIWLGASGVTLGAAVVLAVAMLVRRRRRRTGREAPSSAGDDAGSPEAVTDPA